MCEANAYILDKDGNQELFLERVDTLTVDANGLILENIFSEKKFFQGTIKELALVNHRIILQAQD
ncbi:MAG: CooT family nickel-binding protein [Sporomusaceae bacterium]|jgi:predicted RNA-binding protein|nr:CooT family nickel-binding protein [Sporomusaceae bacterium]